MNPIFIKKSDGTSEEFDIMKLKESLERSGAQPTVVDKIIRTITEDLKVSSERLGEKAVCDVTDIYKQAFSMLKKMSVSAAARYSLRRSIMEIGPTGFPFEEFVAELFKAQGFETLTDQMVLGKCVPHEVDVVAWNKKKLLMAEVKYHNELAGKTDLKVALYVKARFDDLSQNKYQYTEETTARKLDEGWLVTNTKFTETAITYGECSKLKLLSWNYPKKGNILDLIEQHKLHPITCLTSLTSSDKKSLIARKIMLCKELYENKTSMKELGMSEAKIFKTYEEIGNVFKELDVVKKALLN
ncbi:MAG: ATP cone domain-containing protein [bacterium]